MIRLILSRVFPRSKPLRLATACIVTLFANSTVGVMAIHASNTELTVTLLDSPIGQMRDEIITAAETQWGSSANCTSQKTGVGVNRRAYFFETCTLDNTRSVTMYDETPAVVSYYFLEERLVQVAYDFQSILDLKMLKRCAEQDVKKTNANQPFREQAVLVDDNGRTRVFDAQLAPQIKVLKTP